MEDDTGTLGSNGRKTTIVVTRDAGVILGNVNRVFIDLQSKRISALSFRRKYLGQEFFLKMQQVERIGEDVVFVSSDTMIQPLTKTDQAPGEDLRNFQGVWAFTQGGQPVAAITDLGFDQQTWILQTLYFCDDRAVEVNAADVTLAHDKVVIQADLVDAIISPAASHGLLAGLFGSEGIEEAGIVLQRALRGLPTQSFHG